MIRFVVCQIDLVIESSDYVKKLFLIMFVKFFIGSFLVFVNVKGNVCINVALVRLGIDRQVFYGDLIGFFLFIVLFLSVNRIEENGSSIGLIVDLISSIFLFFNNVVFFIV